MKYIPGDIVLLADQLSGNVHRPHIVIHNDVVKGLRVCPLSTSSVGRTSTDRLPARLGGLKRASYVAAVDGIQRHRWHVKWAKGYEVSRHVGTLDKELLQVALLAIVTQQEVCKKARHQRCATMPLIK